MKLVIACPVIGFLVKRHPVHSGEVDLPVLLFLERIDLQGDI